MAEGSNAYKGLAVPLWGESEIKQVHLANDILTLTAVTGATGDFLVCQTAGGGELFVIEADGAMRSPVGLILGSGAGEYLRFSGMPTTAPTTGLTKGDFFVVNGSTNMQLALCIDSTQNTLRYFVPNSITFGRDTLA